MSEAQENLVVGYFSDGANAFRAINELIDEGFGSSEIGAAFRSPQSGTQPAFVEDMTEDTEPIERDPTLSSSPGGPTSLDESVTPAGLSPGSGNAFPGAPSTPGPIPGAEIPQNLPHDLRETLPHDLPSTLRASSNADDRWIEHLSRTYGGKTAKNRNSAASHQKFGTGEGTLGLFPEYEYSETAFEGSFAGMGFEPEQARSLSGELGRGGAVISVNAGERSSLAEAILERNHGRVRFEYAAGTTTQRAADRESPVQIYGSMRSYYRPNEERHRKAS